MKKFIIIFLVIALFIIGYSYDQFAWCKRVFLGSPLTHKIQKGEYLSHIAQQYYGNASYWRELALVNRAPDSDAIFPGEEIIIPSLESIKKIRRTRWLSRVNGYVKNQEDILAGRLAEPEGQKLALDESEPTTESEPVVQISEPEVIAVGNNNNNPVQSSSLYLAIAIVGIILIGSMTGFILYRRKKYTDQFYYNEDVDEPTKKEQSEPDYQEYLNKKNRKKKVSVV